MLKVTVDTVVFTIRAGKLAVLLVRRGIAPAKGALALPGGFLHEGESLEDAALRELRSETGVAGVYLEQLYTFGAPDRDPRGRVITVAYYALISADHPLNAGSDAAGVAWHDVDTLPKTLAFDHRTIIDYALERLRNKLEYTTVGFQLLPSQFTLGQLQEVYEAILGRELDRSNFRQKVASLKILTPVGTRTHQPERGRPAQLYRFSAKRFEKLKDKGILFPF